MINARGIDVAIARMGRVEILMIILASSPEQYLRKHMQHSVYSLNFSEIMIYLIRDYGSEEIRILSKGLVADHDCTSSHHFSFDFCCDFAQFSHPVAGTILGKFSGSQTLRNIPKNFVKNFKNLKILKNPNCFFEFHLYLF